MLVSPITILPYPFPVMPHPGNGNGGVVPPWMQRDLGVEATQVTDPAHAGWFLVTK